MTKAELSQAIRMWEGAPASLPLDSRFDLTRQQLQSQVAEAKRQITELKPLAQRTEMCRQAAQRAESRHAAAQDAAQQAQAAVQTAATELDNIRAELRSLEHQLSAQSPPAAADSSLDHLRQGLEHVMADMCQRSRPRCRRFFDTSVPSRIEQGSAEEQFQRTLRHQSPNSHPWCNSSWLEVGRRSRSYYQSFCLQRRSPT